MWSSWKSCCSCIAQRWIFTILSSTGLFLGFVYSGFLSITIIEMVESFADPNEEINGSCGSVENNTTTNKINLIYNIDKDDSIERYPWTEYTQGIILSSFAWSYTAGRFFYGPLVENFGGKYILGLGILTQAVLTLITPLILNFGGSSTILIVTRVLVGLANSGMYPAVSKMIPHWTTPQDRTIIGNAVYNGPVLGMVFGNVVPALIIENSSIGWPAVFYFLGILGVIWFPFWLIFVYESPQVHPFLSDQELQYLKNTSEVEKVECNLPPAPLKQIFKCKEFWAFTIVYTGSNWPLYVMMSGLPRYMGKVVKFSLESNGYFSSLPYIFMWLNSMASAWINDKIIEKQWMSVTNVRKLLTSFSTTAPAIFLLFASYAECNKTIVVIMFVLGVTFFGNFIASTMLNPIDLSPNYAATIMALGEGIASIVGIIAPYVIGVIAPNSMISEWRLLFWIVFFFATSSNLVYLIWFKAEVQPWNDPNFLKCKKDVGVEESHL